MSTRQVAAVAALVLIAATLVLAVWTFLTTFPLGLVVVTCLLVSLGTAWYGLRRRGPARSLGLGVAGIVFLTGALVIVFGGRPFVDVLTLACGALALVSARTAFWAPVHLPPAAPPRQPVLFINPRSGGGKAERFDLAGQARARGILPVVLRPEDDLETLVRAAVDGGAGGLAMAGGDGSQAVVAAVAAEHGLPYACVPSGTRNHFALDLGVDRNDVVGALDAFVDGGEHVVDLGEVNGRVFVNNVSLGLYAEAVQRPGYRSAKVKTMLDIVPDVLGPDTPDREDRHDDQGSQAAQSAQGTGLGLRWVSPAGHEHRSGAVVLVSNNRYRLGRAISSGTRPRIDDGLLGIVVLEPPGAPGRAAGDGSGEDTGAHRTSRRRLWHDWSATTFTVDADHPVAAGIDGESVLLEPPIRFRIRPGVLHARIARRHPGASPSATQPERVADIGRALFRMAFTGR